MPNSNQLKLTEQALRLEVARHYISTSQVLFRIQIIYKQKPPFGAKICSNICPRTLSVPRSEQFSELSSRKTVLSFEEQIMSKDTKYPSIFSSQLGAIVFIILQIFFATRAVLKIGEYVEILIAFLVSLITLRLPCY